MKIFKRNTLSFHNFNTALSHIFHNVKNEHYSFDTWYQRDQAWTMKEKQDFLKSLLNDEELGTFIYYERDVVEIDDKEYIEIIDGNNRINCLKDFYENKLPYILDDVEYYYKDIDLVSKRFLGNKSIAIKSFRGEHRKLTDKEKVQIYLNFNKKGVPQSREHLEKLEKFLESED